MSSARGVDAVVLVGGQGTRLRPLTLSTPKPMLPTAGVPYLTHLLSRIRAIGIRHIVFGTSYMAEVFSEHFGDGAALDMELEYLVESEPLDTGGGIRNVLGALREPDVMVFNCDILSGVDLAAVLDTHRSHNADATIHLVKVPDPQRFGCVPTDPDGRITAFLEKVENPPTDQINAGCYVFRRDVIESIPAGRPVSVEYQTFPGLLAAGARLQGHVEASYWLDVGTPESFVRGSSDLVLGIAPTSALPGPVGQALILPDAKVDPGAVITGGTTVGAGCVIASGAVVDGSVLFAGVRIDAGARVERSALGRGASVGADAVLADTVVGDGASIGPRCELRAGARVWPGIELPECAVRFSKDT